jgi:hypothetical protein
VSQRSRIGRTSRPSVPLSDDANTALDRIEIRFSDYGISSEIPVKARRCSQQYQRKYHYEEQPGRAANGNCY